jgi:hypothetical protein
MPDRAVDGFRRSSYCGGGSCVEVARTDGGVALRDSKAPWKEEHVFTAEEWVAFVRGVKAGEFDIAALTS